MNENYDFKSIETKWIKKWDESKEFRVKEDPSFPADKRLYVLDMFPYPSGSGLHVGHPEGYTATDIFTRFKKMNGYNVLHPMGYDSFGLPAENYAIKTGTHPAVTTRTNIDRFREQIKTFGFAYDWDREISTCEPDYYKWTQWIFLQLYKKGLAYESEMPINWCPDCLTGLANEEVKEGCCDRCGSQIERRRIRQWVLKITEYAERLLADLDGLDWSESIKAMQQNWIGRSEGAEVDFVIEKTGEKLRVYTTRPDTLFGATYMVLAPEHSAVQQITSAEQKEQVDNYIIEAAKKSDLQRTELNKDKTGVFTGAYAINPVNGSKIPIWISDYVLISYGTGAIMAVPAHDTRDFEFAKKYDIPIIQVVSLDGSLNDLDEAMTQEGIAVNSGQFDGLKTLEFKSKIIEWLEKECKGQKAINYKLRDWIFSRQRYWGEPIPLVHCDKCGIVPVKEEDLPLTLPEVDSYTPTGTGESPLAAIKEWVNTKCPVCDGDAKRETNTMPQWAGSCWYYLRYMDPANSKALVDPDILDYWGSVDLYVGGAEHAVLHLLYSRFWHKVLLDCGVVSFKEPFQKLRNQGMILGENNEKMSKSRGNVINPDDVIAEFGADSLRMYEMFMGPLAADKPWNTSSIFGVKRFLDKVWRLQDKISSDSQLSPEALKMVHKTIKSVTYKIDNLDFNTAISQLMILLNTLQKEPAVTRETYQTLLTLLHPFAPFITEELWEQYGNGKSMLKTNWPSFDPDLAVDDVITVVFQVNGKVRSREELSADSSKEEMLEIAKNNDKIKQYLDGKTIIKEIVVLGKLVNLVVK
ncbi:MAG TPA: leucine--tRNA ligase [Spirochaetota bacterium]|nr:leucine--tRNA ligase [Spirochaetota bacterium]